MDCLVAKSGDDKTRHARLRERLAALLGHESPDLILLQEAADEAAQLLAESGFRVTVKERLVTAVREADWALHADVQPNTSHRVLVATYRRLSDGAFLIVWNVHLPSLLRTPVGRIEEAVRDLVTHAGAHRGVFGLGALEVIGGDFNLPPFNGHVMLAQRDFLRAGRSTLWAQRQEQETLQRHFVNTAWRLLGRADEPLATLYAEKHAMTFQPLDDAPWHQVDQVLLSPSLLRGRSYTCDLRTSAGDIDLSTLNNPHRKPSRSRGSDHYPTVVTIVDLPARLPYSSTQQTGPLPSASSSTETPA